MAYWQLYYHVVWTTKLRQPLFTPELEADLHQYLRGKAIELGAIVHAVGGIEDHVHAALSIPPRLAIATHIGQLKGASSHWVTHVSPYKLPFAWQEGYGVLSFAKRSLPSVVRYILNQRQHHYGGQLIAEMERTESEESGDESGDESIRSSP